MQANQMFLVGNDDFTTILLTVDSVATYVPEVLKIILENNQPVDLRISTRPAIECRQFLAGLAPSPQPAQKQAAPKKMKQQKTSAPAKADDMEVSL